MICGCKNILQKEYLIFESSESQTSLSEIMQKCVWISRHLLKIAKLKIYLIFLDLIIAITSQISFPMHS